MAQKLPTYPLPDEIDDEQLSSFDFISQEEAVELFELQAQRYMKMSGEEYRRQYKAGLLDLEDSNVIRVSFLMYMAEK